CVSRSSRLSLRLSRDQGRKPEKTKRVRCRSPHADSLSLWLLPGDESQKARFEKRSNAALTLGPGRARRMRGVGGYARIAVAYSVRPFCEAERVQGGSISRRRAAIFRRLSLRQMSGRRLSRARGDE